MPRQWPEQPYIIMQFKAKPMWQATIASASATIFLPDGDWWVNERQRWWIWWSWLTVSQSQLYGGNHFQCTIISSSGPDQGDPCINCHEQSAAGWSEFGRDDIQGPVYLGALQLVKQSRWMGLARSHRLWCSWWKAPKDGISLGCWTELFFLTFLLFLSLCSWPSFLPHAYGPSLWVLSIFWGVKTPNILMSHQHLASIISTQSICFSKRISISFAIISKWHCYLVVHPFFSFETYK
jgi:hypothetical protein